MTVVALPVEGGKFRLYYRSSPHSRPVPCGPHLGRANPMPFYDFGSRDHATALKDAKRLQAYIDREHKVRYV